MYIFHTVSWVFLLLFLQVLKMPASGTASASHPITDAGEAGGKSVIIIIIFWLTQKIPLNLLQKTVMQYNEIRTLNPFKIRHEIYQRKKLSQENYKIPQRLRRYFPQCSVNIFKLGCFASTGGSYTYFTRTALQELPLVS